MNTKDEEFSIAAFIGFYFMLSFILLPYNEDGSINIPIRLFIGTMPITMILLVLISLIRKTEINIGFGVGLAMFPLIFGKLFLNIEHYFAWESFL
jgi:hypothetical protein